MSHEKSSGQSKDLPPKSSEGPPGVQPSIEDFLKSVSYDMHQPKPGPESVAAALQAVQRLAFQMDAEEPASAAETSVAGHLCSTCGSLNREENRFCAICGVPLAEGLPPQTQQLPTTSQTPPAAPAAGSHHYHHHYHHHYFSAHEGTSSLGGSEARIALNPPSATGDAGRVRTSSGGGASLSRAETAVRKLAQEWALACNTKQLDDLVSLYAADAVVLRPNVPAVRGAAAIREFFVSVLDAGLGDVEMEPLRTEVIGEIAYEAGRCQMLVPVAMNKRREERGKYLVLLARQSGDWKILADCWSSDLSLGVTTEPAPAKPMAPAPPIARPVRKGP